MRPNSIFGTVPPTICLIEIDGQKFRKDAHSNQEPSDKHDNTRPVHARSYPDTSNRVNYDRTCLDLQLNGIAVLADDIASITVRITKGSFVRAHESTQSVHLSSWWHDISNDRMTKDKATDPAKTSSNKNTSNDIKDGKTKELSAVDEQSVIFSDLYQMQCLWK